MKPAAILLTCDIHTHTYARAQVDEDLAAARQALRVLGLPATWFFPATSAELLPEHVRGLEREGHEIGCHGLQHDPAEHYGRLPLARQRTLLREATERLEPIMGRRPVSFRAPVFKISGATIQALDELGYHAESSVNAQRFSVFGSDLYDMRPLFAHRRPYHPSAKNPFRPGPAALWEIPVSALGVPFVSNTERAFGLWWTRRLFHALLAEARLTGKPIVFAFHAEDFNEHRGVEPHERFSWASLIPSRTYGLQARYWMLERDWRHVSRDIIALLQTMRQQPQVQFLTVRDYAAGLKGHPPRPAKQADAVSDTLVMVGGRS